MIYEGLGWGRENLENGSKENNGDGRMRPTLRRSAGVNKRWFMIAIVIATAIE